MLLASLGLFIGSARANVMLPSIISTHAVLQKSDHTQIWGKAAPGEKVRISIGGVQAETAAGTDGKWKTTLDVSGIGEGPFDLVIEGANRLVVSDILIGEVWVCSGQSNMAVTLTHVGEAAQEIPQSANPKLRQFRVLEKTSATPEDECKGLWTVADPTTTPQFTAVGYFFGKHLQQNLQQPVGLILAAVAGTSALNWMPQAAFETDPGWKNRKDKRQKGIDDYPKLKEGYLPAYRQWITQYNREDHPADPSLYAATDIPLDDWKKVTLPSKLKDVGLPDSGAVWFRKKITLPPGPVETQRIELGAVKDFNALYINGKKIRETTVESMKAGFAVHYFLPKDAFREGENTLAVRVFTPSERAMLATTLYVETGAKGVSARTVLNGEWLAKVEFELPAMSDEVRKALPAIPPDPGLHSYPGLFDAMIHPLMAFTIQGVLWYQGEQDAGQTSAGYWKMLQAVIQGWRAGWGSDITFYCCQLPNFGAKKDLPPAISWWAELREAQSKALTLPNTGLAVLIDIGDEDVHPLYKKPVGERLAQVALARTYKQKVVGSGPVYKSMQIQGDKVRLSFLSTDGGLVAKPLLAQYQPTNLSPALKPLVRHSTGGELEGFAIYGDDKKWSWATAKIEGDAVVVWSPDVPKPVAVRYAWADNPTCNLYNGAGLPAAPFQTGN